MKVILDNGKEFKPIHKIGDYLYSFNPNSEYDMGVSLNRVDQITIHVDSEGRVEFGYQEDDGNEIIWEGSQLMFETLEDAVSVYEKAMKVLLEKRVKSIPEYIKIKLARKKAGELK